MPSIMKNAVCGPQKPGTKRPGKWGDIESLNPCPLNACCDVWGYVIQPYFAIHEAHINVQNRQYGTTSELCKKTKVCTFPFC